MNTTLSTTAIKVENYDALRPGLRALQVAVWNALLAVGPSTTRELSAECGIPLLTLRPRMTELVELGLAKLCGRKGREGVYEVAGTTLETCLAAQVEAVPAQKELGL